MILRRYHFYVIAAEHEPEAGHYEAPFILCDFHLRRLYIPPRKTLHCIGKVEELDAVLGANCKFCEFDEIKKGKEKSNG